jgi:hypothetical protein
VSKVSTVGQQAGGRRDARLTEEGIYAAALELIDRDGIEALSMRKLAAALDATTRRGNHKPTPNPVKRLRSPH